METTPVNPAPEPAGRKKRGMGRTVLLIILLAVAGYGVWTLYDLYLTPDRNIRQIYLVPRNAAIIIQTDDPLGDWKKLAASEPWQGLKRAPYFADISGSADMLDSLLKANGNLFSIVGRREMIVSLHRTRTAGSDFLAIVDMRKASKLNTLKDNVEQFFKASGFNVTNRRYKGVNITESRDPQTMEILHTAFIDNHFLASYNGRLVEQALDEREDPRIGLNDSFLEVEKMVAGKGLCRIYINYAYLPQYLSIYMGRNEWIETFCRSMDFGGLYLVSDRRKMEISGFMTIGEEPDPYVEALLNSGSRRMGAHEIMPARTAFYLNLGFESTDKFVKELEKALALHDKDLYDSYRSGRAKIEKYFDISLQDNFLDWMDGEFAVCHSEPGLLGREAEQLLAIKAKDISKARESLELIEKRINKRTPVSIRVKEYKGFEVKYIELNGFFRLFFGKLFDSFEKPYYTYVGDYVVLSNKATTLLSFLEDYEQRNLMISQEGFGRAFAQVGNNSTIFAYVDMLRFYPLLRPLLSAETWSAVESNKDVLFSFPQWTWQAVSGARGGVSLQTVFNYLPYAPSGEESRPDDRILTDADEDQSDKELMSELKRFYVENFEGNVLREYYPTGELMSESEVSSGKRHGRYREFYPDGKLKVRGAYSANRPRGVWKHYTEEGKLDRRERF